MRRLENGRKGNFLPLPFIFFRCLCFIFFTLLCLSFLAVAQSKQLADYPNQLTRDGELVILPDRGTAYIATDFHTHWSDFNQWLERTKLIEKIEAGEDVYGLILGDAVDHKPGDSIVERFGDVKIVDRIMQLQEQLGTKGKRLIYLKGNHEFAAADTYAMLKRAGMNDNNQHDFIRKLYQTPNGPYYQQFNFIERMTDKHYDYLISLPTIAVGKNGFVGVHAGTSRSAKSLADLIQPTKKVLEEFLWDRPTVAKSDGYTLSHTETFLKRIGGRVLIVGHTPLIYFTRKKAKDGVARLGKYQLFFATGYGAEPGVRSYLAIDLSKKYESVSDLKYEVEIYSLYP